MTTETEPMVRILSIKCSRCGSEYKGALVRVERAASGIRLYAREYVHGVPPPFHDARDDGTAFWFPDWLAEVTCGGSPLYATEPVR